MRSLEEISKIKEIIGANTRNQLLFCIGIESGLRMKDILQLRVKQVVDLNVGQSTLIKETKTNKYNIFVINNNIYKYLHKHINVHQLKRNDYLFRSRNKMSKQNGPITSHYAGKLIKRWCKEANLTGRFGAHTPRKTWGFMQRTMKNTDYSLIAKRFNHENPRTTVTYLCIQDEELQKILQMDISL